MQSSKTKIAIVEDQEDMMQFLSGIFQNAPDFECIQSYRNAEEAILFLPKSKADIVIVDIRLPDKNGIECVREVKSKRPKDMQFLMYTVLEENDKIFESLKAGANGYLLKTTKEEEILAAVRDLVDGGAPMSSSIARKVTDHFYGLPSRYIDLLSPRENEVLRLLSQGYTYKEISKKMKITIGTVKQYIHKIYQKLHVKNKTAAINKYLRGGQ